MRAGSRGGSYERAESRVRGNIVLDGEGQGSDKPARHGRRQAKWERVRWRCSAKLQKSSAAEAAASTQYVEARLKPCPDTKRPKVRESLSTSQILTFQTL